MKHLLMSAFLSLFLVSDFAHAILKPSLQSSPALGNDPFLNYQWPLENNGQEVITDLDDIHPMTILGNPKIQIGWKNFDALMKKEVLVAVLDSGLDGSHPELKGKFVAGFNFTVDDPKKAKIFDDDTGHGTHIAGIMAAISGNGEGIAGLSSKIKILPLKVYDSKEDSSVGARRTPISERVAKAVEMAIEFHADIIHLSMGWPRIANTSKVEAAFKKARDAGILVVAAAGNDHHQAQIFPCAYQEVICVGSVNIDGGLSNFSNFGGHVDIVAPGQEILSLWPLLKSSQFGPKGYELKSGTSQAAPFVSGALAILKSIFPEESARQIRARILLGAVAMPTQTLFGLLNIQNAINADPKTFSAPVFKGIETVDVHPRNLEFDLPVKVDSGSRRPLVEVFTSQPGVKLSVPKLISQNGSVLTFEVKGRVENLKNENRLQYTVSIDGRKYTHQVLLTVQLDQMNPLRVSVPRAELIRKNDLRSLPDLHYGSVVRYWTTEKVGDALRLYVWTLKNGQLEEKSVLLDQISELQNGFNIVAEDWNMDGQTDYLLAGLQRDAKGEAREILFIYLDQDLRILQRMPLKYEGVLPTFQSVKELMVGQMHVPQLGRIKVPVFWDVGLIPEKDLNPNSFAFEKNTSAKRLYYLQPVIVDGSWKMATRTLTASQLDLQIRSRLNLDATQDVEGLGTKIQSLDDLKLGQIELILSVGRGVQVNIFKLNFSDLNEPFQHLQVVPVAKLNFDLAKNQIKESLNLSASELDSGTDFQAIYSPTAARSVVMRDGQFSPLKLTLPDLGEQIISILKSFTARSDVLTFFETTDWLRAQGHWNSSAVNAKAPVYRSSFLPGSLFTQLFVPVVVTGKRSPGVMFDNSQLFSSSAVVYAIGEDGKLSASVNRTFSIPTNCLGRTPVLNDQSFTRLSFLCDQGDRFELKFLDLQ